MCSREMPPRISHKNLQMPQAPVGESAYAQVQLLLASDWRKSMAVKITPKFIHHRGMAMSTEGSVAAWEVTFHIDGDEFLHGSISIPVAGPSTRHEAQQKHSRFCMSS